MVALIQSQARVAVRSSTRNMVAASSRVRSVVVRASEGAAAAPAAEKPAFVAPTLNADTPSPIFGGSTGGLLRKAQVRGAKIQRMGNQRAVSWRERSHGWLGHHTWFREVSSASWQQRIEWRERLPQSGSRILVGTFVC